MKYIIVMTALLLSTGCTHVNQNAFTKLDVGMSIEKVEGILGKPARCMDELGNKQCIWTEGDKEIRVNYINNRVVVFSANGLQ